MLIRSSPVIGHQFAQADEFQGSIVSANAHLYVFAPVAQTLLTDTTGRQNLKLTVLVIPDNADTVGHFDIIYICVPHRSHQFRCTIPLKHSIPLAQR